MASKKKTFNLSETSDSEDNMPNAKKRGRSETGSTYSETGDEEPPGEFFYTQPAATKRHRSGTDSTSGTGDEEVGTTDATEDGDGSSDNLGSPTYAAFNPTVKKMLEKQGYKYGAGLGKHNQGIVNPVEASSQRGRRGLGLSIPGLEPGSNLKWDSSMEVVSVTETVEWLDNTEVNSLSSQELQHWKEEGPKKERIEDETEFCDPSVLADILKYKSVFDSLEPEELKKARTRSNPFEHIRNGIFLNRAAMKMANMDKVFDMMFTNPVDPNNRPVLKENDLLYFADVCAGPGGFSEYVLWRKKWRAKGFGFTLKGENDFRLSDFYAGPSESFEPHYGAKGADGNGDVYDPDNIMAFKKYVLENTDGEGVHFMMADGGFSVAGQENIQEILSKQLYLCQCLVALYVLRTDGSLVVKLFDLFTHFSVSLVYLMYRSFRSISIHKPNTSRPANSERYLICKFKREDCEDIADYLYRINSDLWLTSSASNTTIRSIVPLSILRQDENFIKYIIDSNNSLGRRQAVNLLKIHTFCRDDQLVEEKQATMTKDCLKYWGVPDTVRTQPEHHFPDERVPKLLGEDAAGYLNPVERVLNFDELSHTFRSVHDWHCCVLGIVHNDPVRCAPMFYLGLGRRRVYRFEGKKWKKTDEEFKAQLSPDTLVYAQVVAELVNEGRSQRRIYSFHIIDGLFLGGEDIRHYHLEKRIELCEVYAKSLNKPSINMLYPIRAKKWYELEDIRQIFQSLKERTMKNAKKCMSYPIVDNYYSAPTGFLFFNATQAPWTKQISKKTNFAYYYNIETKKSLYASDRPIEAVASFKSCITNRITWSFGEDILNMRNSTTMRCAEQLMKYVESKK